MTDQLESLKKLREPFAPNQIGKLPKGGIQLDFVGHAHITARLLDVDPLWEWEPFAVDASGLPMLDEFGGLWIRLKVCGKTRIGYGDAEGKKGTQAIKVAIGDALRNAGMRFGIALDLWAKGDLEAASQRSEPAEPTELDLALDDLQGTCEALKLDPKVIAGRFFAETKKPARQATAEQIRAFIDKLCTESEVA